MNEAPPLLPVPNTPPDFRDRRSGLIGFGVLLILVGLGCLLLVLAVLAAQTFAARSTGSPANLRLLLPAMLTYGGLAVLFLILGIGSIRCRRWARALVLMLSWVWLAVGLLAVPLTAVMVHKAMTAAPPGGPSLPPGMLPVVLIAQVVFMSVFLIALPGLLAWFYGKPDVLATCQTRDPSPRWTDACPLPVLGVACLLWLGAGGVLLLPLAYGGVLPLFGRLLSGWSGTLAAVAFALTWLMLGFGCYRLRPGAWWAVILLFIVLTLSNVLTFSRIDLMEMYWLMGYPAEQIELIRQQNLVTGPILIWSSALGTVPPVLYLLWVKRFFRPKPVAV